MSVTQSIAFSSPLTTTWEVSPLPAAPLERNGPLPAATLERNQLLCIWNSIARVHSLPRYWAESIPLKWHKLDSFLTHYLCAQCWTRLFGLNPANSRDLPLYRPHQEVYAILRAVCNSCFDQIEASIGAKFEDVVDATTDEAGIQGNMIVHNDIDGDNKQWYWIARAYKLPRHHNIINPCRWKRLDKFLAKKLCAHCRFRFFYDCNLGCNQPLTGKVLRKTKNLGIILEHMCKKCYEDMWNSRLPPNKMKKDLVSGLEDVLTDDDNEE